MSDVWAADDTTPGAIEAALRGLLVSQHAESASYVPARVLNLVTIVDRQWRGEIENRLERVGRFHASRTVLCAVDGRRTKLAARASITVDAEPKPGEFAATHEHVVVDVGTGHLPHLDTIVDPLVVTDLPTMVWAPHGHEAAVDALLDLAQVVLLDSVDEPEIDDAVRRARGLADRAYVVDLAWLRTTPWRERVAATFDPPVWRSQLGAISSVAIRHRPDSAVAGALFLGWLASRLGWEPAKMARRRDELHGRARARRQEIALTLTPDAQQSAPGLAGLTIETAQGLSISLDRGPGGLQAHRSLRRGSDARWTVMGASRGEAGILGEGIRQALLRDPTYRPALDAAWMLVG